jgi:proline iminopeptidase
MKTLYPPIKPYAQHELEVGSPHKLYVEECGNPNGIPVLFVHGGPGAGCSVDDRRFFDPELYRVVLFDQRGCGRSVPHASLENNTTQDLIADMEQIRQFMKISRWMLFGGSWGSTLSLAYAQTYPEQVMGLVLRGIFLCRQQDLNWFYKEGASHIFADYWDLFVKYIPREERSDLIEAYYQRLTGQDELARMGAAKNWAQWEAHCATLQPSKDVVNKLANPHTAMSLARIETHYFRNKIFLAENDLITNAPKLANIPGVIIHGRYDMCCPLDNALKLHKVWSQSELHIIRDAGHSSMEPGTTCALIRATDMMASFLD